MEQVHNIIYLNSGSKLCGLWSLFVHCRKCIFSPLFWEPWPQGSQMVWLVIGALGCSISHNFRGNWGPKVLVWISTVSRRRKVNCLGTATLNSNKISGHWMLGRAFVVTRHTLWPGGGSMWLHGQNGTRNLVCSFFPALSSSSLGWLKFIYFCYNKTWPEYSAFLSPVWIYWNTKVFVGNPKFVVSGGMYG